MIGDTWDQTESMRIMKYLLSDSSKHKTRVQQLDFIGPFLQANVKHRFFVKLDRRYGEYFPEYGNYFGRPLILNKYMYGMNNYGNIFADELTNWMMEESGYKQSQCQIFIYLQVCTRCIQVSYIILCL